MSEWKETTLSDMADIVPGFAFKGEHFGDTGTMAIKIKDIIPPRIYLHSAQRVDISHYSLKKLKKYRLYKGDYVVAMTGATIGKVGRLIDEDEVYINQRVAKIEPKNQVDRDFVYYCLVDSDFGDFVQNNIDSHSAQENISGTSLGRYPINSPPLSEQKAIASVLSSLDDKIDLLHRQNKTLEAMAEALFRQWFVEEAGEDWPFVKVGDFVSTNISSLTKSNSIQCIKYLDTGSLTEGKIESYQEMNIDEAPSRARRIVKHKDILISTVRPNHKHYGILHDPYHDLVVSTGFCVISCKNICPYFLYIFLTSDDMTEYLHSIAEGSTSTYPSLKPSDIEALEFNLPPKQKMEQFSCYANSAWGKIDKNYKQIRTLEQLRDTLLPKLMSGEVRVTC